MSKNNKNTITDFAEAWQYDYHIHTGHFLCADKEMIADNILPVLRKNNTKRFGLSEHLYPLDWAERVGVDFKESHANIRKDFPDSEIPVLFGMEACIRNGHGELVGEIDGRMEEIAPDYVLGGAHHIWFDWVESDFNKDWNIFLKSQHSALLGACSNPRCHAIAHPWGIGFSAMDTFGLPWIDDYNKLPLSIVEELADAAAETDTGLEINADIALQNKTKLADTKSEIYINSLREFAEILLSKGCRLFFGSDSHNLKQLTGSKKIYDLLGLKLSREQLWTP